MAAVDERSTRNRRNRRYRESRRSWRQIRGGLLGALNAEAAVQGSRIAAIRTATMTRQTVATRNNRPKLPGKANELPPSKRATTTAARMDSSALHVVRLLTKAPQVSLTTEDWRRA